MRSPDFASGPPGLPDPRAPGQAMSSQASSVDFGDSSRAEVTTTTYLGISTFRPQNPAEEK